jgi:signal transduction histidine kinase/DNA-binding response OmpR family regulator
VAQITTIKNDSQPGTAGGTLANILIVDDLPEKHLVYKSILNELGQNLIFANSGQEALKQVLQRDFAVILLDVNMPGMDGFETASLIRKRKKSAGTPIIFLTAFSDEVHATQGYASGAVDYLSTPVMPEVLKAKVRVFIELSQMREQATYQAEERAQRAAAEKSARRLDFLVTVSEAFARARQVDDILKALVRLPVPYLADACFVWFFGDGKEAERIEWASADTTAPAGSQTSFFKGLPWLEKTMRHVAETGRLELLEVPPSVVSDISLPVNFSRFHSALVLPLVVQNRTCGAMMLGRISHSFQPDKVSLAGNMVSRANLALENAILIERIRDADRRKDEFLATLAHELRNPLAPLSNALQVLRMNEHSLLPMVIDSVDVMQLQVRNMTRMVDDLLDVSRITQGKIDIRRETVELSAIVKNAIETSDPLIKQMKHQLTVDLPAAPVYVKGDFTRLSQMFSNLLNNAAKYTAPKGKIFLKAMPEDGHVSISIRDTGIGIPKAMLENVFGMFTQVDSSIERSHGGLGIGLKLARELCELHGGTIRAASAGIGKGSEFTVRLPVAVKEENARPAEQNETIGPHKAYRILVVDDNEASAMTTLWAMERFGHEVQTAHDGPSAIELVRSFTPQVVLLDIGLPGMNGYDVCRTLRENAALKNTLFIAQTGWGQPEHRQRSKEAGFHHHLVKPVDQQALQKLLQEPF